MAGTEDTIDRGDTFAPTADVDVDADNDKLTPDTLGTTLEDELAAKADAKAATTFESAVSTSAITAPAKFPSV